MVNNQETKQPQSSQSSKKSHFFVFPPITITSRRGKISSLLLNSLVGKRTRQQGDSEKKNENINEKNKSF